MPSDELRRRSRLAGLAAAVPVDAVLVTRLVNVRYLTGFSGSSAALLLLVGGDAPSAVVATDGLFLSVCDTNWDEHMDKLVAASFGGGGEYFRLTGNPLPSTIVVYLHDVKSSEGWAYDESVNSVVFEDDAYPIEGTEVRIKFLKAVGCG